MHKSPFVLVALAGLGLLLGLALASCDLFRNPPEIEPQPPLISELQLIFESLAAGMEATVTFRYEDANGDVGPETAEVEIQAEVLSGNLKLDEPLSRVLGAVRADGKEGRTGSVEVAFAIETPPTAYGVIRLSVALFDRAGQRSNSLSGELAVGGGGVADACTFVDGDHNPVTTYRVGRQLFFRVKDPDNDTYRGRVDVLYDAVAVQAGATGDREVIAALVETGPGTGLFEGPVGGLLLVSWYSESGDGVLFVLDRDTVFAIYQDPNDGSDVCIALAKIE